VAVTRPPKQEWLFTLLDRRLVDVTRLADDAATAGDEVQRCCAWMAVQRQAERYLLALQPWSTAKLPDDFVEHVSGFRTELERHRATARSALEGFDETVRRRAKADLGLRVAVIGKGGSGKSFLAGTLARFLAQRGRRVLAADLDSNPGLSYSLGLGATEAGLPDDALEEHPGADYGWHLAPHLAPFEAVERFSTPGPDRLRYLGIGKISAVDKVWCKRSVAAVIGVLRGFGDPGWDLIGDLEGGPTTPFERYHSFADLVIVVVGPSWVSTLTARRLLGLVDDLPTLIVANRVEPGCAIADLSSVLRIPPDSAVAEAERLGLAPFDYCPDAPAVTAIGDLADILTREDVKV